MISDLEEHSRAMNTVNYQTIVHGRHKRPSKKQIFLVDNQGEWGAGGKKEEIVTSVTISMCFEGRRGEKERASHISHKF